MNGPFILALIDLMLTSLEKLVPQFLQAVKSGEITPVEQQAVLDRINKLRDPQLSFSGPEWEVKP